jgi:hypothetical protein
MGKFITLLTFVIAAVALPAKPSSMKELTFLTRDGCVNTSNMGNNLDDALKSLGLSADYAYVDIGRLQRQDARRGYPTPTVLYKGKDIFGMPAPKPPFDEPS